jgi:hypothetical protein
MKLPPFFWIKRFSLQASLWAIAVMFGTSLLGLWYPTSHWLFADGWQWMPFDKWLTYALGGIPIGFMAGGFMTLGEWLQHTDARFIQKLLTSLTVVPCLIGLMMLGIRVVHWVVSS